MKIRTQYHDLTLLVFAPMAIGLLMMLIEPGLNNIIDSENSMFMIYWKEIKIFFILLTFGIAAFGVIFLSLKLSQNPNPENRLFRPDVESKLYDLMEEGFILGVRNQNKTILELRKKLAEKEKSE